jgi:hypothetical protein
MQHITLLTEFQSLRQKMVHLIDVPSAYKPNYANGARTTDSTRKATKPYQGIAMDYGFIVQKSKDSSRTARFAGLNGETCYILAVCHFCNELKGAPRVSKTAPTWLCHGSVPTFTGT